MPILSIIFGGILTAIGIAGYAHGVSTGHASFTALIPAVFGTLLEIFGVVAMRAESMRKHLMHAAVVVAFIGFAMTAGRLVMKASLLDWSAALISQLAMSIVCLVFVILAVRSFVAARG